MDVVTNILVAFIESFILYRLTDNVLTFKFSKEKHTYPFFAYFLISIARYVLITYNESLYSVMKITALLLTLAVIFFFYSNSLISKLLWYCVNYFIVAIIEVISIFIISIPFSINIERVLNAENIYIYCVIISKIINCIVIEYIVRKRKFNVVVPKSFKLELVIIFLLDFALILVSLFLNVSPQTLSDNSDLYLSGTLIIVLVISGITISLCYKLTNLANQELEDQLKLQQIEMESSLNEDLSSVVSNLRSLRHDMNNHIGIMKGLVETKEYDLLEQYLADIYKETENANSYQFVGNQTLQILLNSKISKAQNRKIPMETNIEVNEINISDKDVCTLLGNIIDNAIEATEKNIEKSFIKLIIKEKNNSCFIHCENTFSVPPVMKNGKFITSKRNSIHHGIGTENIKSIVKKYNGTIDFDFSDLFVVNITLPC